MSVKLYLNQVVGKNATRLLKDVTTYVVESTGRRQVQCFKEDGEFVHVPFAIDLSWLSPSAFPPSGASS